MITSGLNADDDTADCSGNLNLNILAVRNRKSGNLEIRVPVLGNHLFCA